MKKKILRPHVTCFCAAPFLANLHWLTTYYIIWGTMLLYRLIPRGLLPRNDYWKVLLLSNTFLLLILTQYLSALNTWKPGFVMLPPHKAFVYELSAVTLMAFSIFIVQFSTGAIFSWILWVYSVATVTLGFIDHTITDWKLSWAVQWRRCIMNLATFTVATILFTGMFYIVFPREDLKTYKKMYTAFKRYTGIYNVYGTFLYIYAVYFWHVLWISFLRFYMNVGYIFYMIFLEYHRARTSANFESHPVSPAARASALVLANNR